MNPRETDCEIGAALQVKRMHQSVRKMCLKFQSTSLYGTPKGPMWSNWYTLIYIQFCINQGF